MPTTIAIRALDRNPIRIGTQTLSFEADTIVDLDDIDVRRDLHHYVGRWTTASAPSSALPSVFPGVVGGAFLPVIAGNNTGALPSPNVVRGYRIIIPQTGTLHDLAVQVATTSGNIEVGILDTSATTRKRLWTTGSIACPASGPWHVVGDPALPVKMGDHIDLYVGADNITVAMSRPLNNLQTNAATLPTNFLPAPLGGAPILEWQYTGFPLPATVAESSLAPNIVPFSVIGRIA